MPSTTALSLGACSACASPPASEGPPVPLSVSEGPPVGPPSLLPSSPSRWAGPLIWVVPLECATGPLRQGRCRLPSWTLCLPKSLRSQGQRLARLSGLGPLVYGCEEDAGKAASVNWPGWASGSWCLRLASEKMRRAPPTRKHKATVIDGFHVRVPKGPPTLRPQRSSLEATRSLLLGLCL